MVPGCDVMLFQFNGYIIVDTGSDVVMQQFWIQKCDTVFAG